MNRRFLCLALGVLLFSGSSLRAEAVQLVLSSDAPPYRVAAERARKRLEAAGHTVTETTLKEGESIRPGVIPLAIGTSAAETLRATLPGSTRLYYTMVANPTKSGLRAPDAIGISTVVSFATQMELIEEALPATRSVGVLFDSSSKDHVALVEEIRKDLPKGWKLEPVDIKSFEGLAAAIDHLFAQKVDLVLSYPDAALFDAGCVRALLLGSLRNRVPVFGFSPQFVRAGAVLGTGVAPEDQGDQIGELVIAILAGDRKALEIVKGREPLPVARPFTAVNLIAAERLGVPIAAAAIRRAKHVFGKEEP